MNRIIMENIKNKFFRYKTYYKILGLQERDITDEKVKDAYEKNCEQLNGIFKGIQDKEYLELKERMQEALDDAYTALKTEHSRKNYQKLLEKIRNDDEGNER